MPFVHSCWWRPRPDGLSERRKRLDDLGTQYKIATDVLIESVEENGIRAEWSSTPHADPACAILFLHGGGYVSGSLDSHRPLATEIGRVCRADARPGYTGWRPSIRSPRRSKTQ